MLPQPRNSVHEPSTPSAFPLVLDPALHEHTSTASRQLCHPADFLHAVKWAVTQGLHPRATATTLTVAEKLAAKMNRNGHMAYARERLAAELHLSLSTIRNHTRVLRELGLLVWVEHGTRRNILRTKNPTARPTGYKATATIFAAVAPSYWDRAMGRTTAGHGYTAHLVAVDSLGRAYETALSQLTRTTKDASSERHCPPSVSGFSSSEKFGQKGGNNYTRTRETKISPHLPSSRHWTPITPTRLAELITAAQQIKNGVPWLTQVCVRRLAFQLRDHLLNASSIGPLINELRALGALRVIRRPLAFLATYLRQPKQRTDMPLTWVPVRRAAKAPVKLPRFDGKAACQTPDFGGDQDLWERWDAYCAERAFAEALDRWRDLDKTHHTPNELVPVYPVIDIPVDEEGQRWTDMVERRRRDQEDVLERSASLRARMRTDWADLRLHRGGPTAHGPARSDRSMYLQTLNSVANTATSTCVGVSGDL